MSIQKYYKGRYNKNLRGLLFTAAIFHNVETWNVKYEILIKSSCLPRASTVSKHFFIIPTDAHNYKITGMLKTIKIPITAPTCFGSQEPSSGSYFVLS
jgi:hypothetical protein